MGEHQLKGIESQRTTLGDRAYQSIRDAIISLRLEPGQMVYEAELSSMLGVSRTPVREAFRLLLTEELIDILPQRGIRIAFISRRKVEEARFVRESLEMSGFRLAARMWRSSDETFRNAEARIFATLAEQRRVATADDYEAFLVSDELFHRTVLEHAGNATLLKVIANMRAHLNRVRYLELRTRHHFDAVITQHANIFEAVRGNRSEEAATLVREHLEYLETDFPALISAHATYFKD